MSGDGGGYIINKMYQTTILLHSTGKLISKTRTGLVLENQSDALDIIGVPTPDSSTLNQKRVFNNN